jgi:hypothetical protein
MHFCLYHYLPYINAYRSARDGIRFAIPRSKSCLPIRLRPSVIAKCFDAYLCGKPEVQFVLEKWLSWERHQSRYFLPESEG